MTRPAPIIAAVLLLLPVLYVGSYLALVHPEPRIVRLRFAQPSIIHYRIDSAWPARFFWPLEQFDRKVRPGAWKSPLEKAALK
jgi:hypothetical protein